MKFDLDVTHTIQKEIFRKLVYAPELRFSELKPKKLESNLFMYHLKQLIKNGYVQKEDGKYTLSPSGMAHADKLSLKDLRHRIQSKIITIIALERDDDQWLMLERLHQPLIHTLGFPSGKVHYGEKLHDAVIRELDEKCDIRDVDLQPRGHVIMRFFEGDMVMSHVSGYVYYGKVTSKVKAEKVTRDGRSFWAYPEKLNQEQFIPGYWEIRELIKLKDFFFKEFDFHDNTDFLKVKL